MDPNSETATMANTENIAVTITADIMIHQMGSVLEKHWDEAKTRLSAAEAGPTLKDFLVKNIKLMSLNPWDETTAVRGVTHQRRGGSDNPRTFDILHCWCSCAPTTAPAALLDMDIGSVITVDRDMVIIRAGQWSFCAIPLMPGNGLELRPDERVTCLWARFTVPYEEEAKE